MALFKIVKHDGNPIRIPATCILTIQSCQPGIVKDAPDCVSIVRYDLGIGGGLRVAHLREEYEDVVKRLRKANPVVKKWVEITLWDKATKDSDSRDVLMFDPATIVSVEGIDPDWAPKDKPEEGNFGAASVVTTRLNGQPLIWSSYDDAEEVYALMPEDEEEKDSEVDDQPLPSRRVRRVVGSKRKPPAPKPAAKPETKA